MKKCSEKGCNSPHNARGLCGAHYQKWHRQEFSETIFQYNKSVNGFLNYLYTRMKCRTKGSCTSSPHLYLGKKILPRKDFYEWSKNHPEFLKLHANYVANNYEKKFAPSVDRINPDKGYTLDNMEWVCCRENLRRASVTKKRLK